MGQPTKSFGSTTYKSGVIGSQMYLLLLKEETRELRANLSYITEHIMDHPCVS